MSPTKTQSGCKSRPPLPLGEGWGDGFWKTNSPPIWGTLRFAQGTRRCGRSFRPFIACALLLIAMPGLAAEDGLGLVDGCDISATIRAIDAAGQIESSAAGQHLDLGQLRSIERPIAKDTARKAPI